MTLNDITVVPLDSDSGSEVTVHLGDGSSSHQWIRSDHPLVSSAEDLTPWMFALLPLAMTLGTRLVLKGSVDAMGLSGVSTVQTVFAGWYPEKMRQVPVVTDSTHTSTATEGSASFFSGGVDSFYTLSSAVPPLDSIVYAGGFDIPWADTDRLDRAWATTQMAAAEFSARPIRVNVNIADLTNPHTHFGYVQHGASIAAIANALRNSIGDVLIASSYVDEQLHPWGTHPDLDYLWSTSGQSIKHDRTTETRADKVAALKDSRSFRRGLCVCWRSPLGNCGTCEKCVRTRINLRATGNDGICETLPPLDLADLARLTLSEPAERLFAEETLKYIRAADLQDLELERALVAAIARGVRRVRISKIARSTVLKLPGASSVVDKILRR